jgi:Tn3 transposase DDE domain
VPIEGVVPKAWTESIAEAETGRIERIPYELCVLIALREALRRREIYVEGAGRWRDPDEDLPGDFEDNRDVHYAALAKPVDAAAFVADLKKRMRSGLDRLNEALAAGTAGGVRVMTRKGQPWVSVPKLEKLPEPKNLAALKAEVQRRWGTIDLLDILKDTACLTGFTDEFTSVATREALDKETLRRRLLLCLFALGTNMGIRQMAATGEHGEDEGALRRVRASHITRENLRAAIARVVNETLAARRCARMRRAWHFGPALPEAPAKRPPSEGVRSWLPPSHRERAGRILGEDRGREFGAEFPLDPRAQAAEQERHSRSVGAGPGGRGDRVGSEQDLVSVAGVGEDREAVQHAPVGAVVHTGRAVECQERAGFGGLPVDSGVRESVQVPEDHAVRSDPVGPAQQVEHVQGGGSGLQVDADGRVGGVVRLSGGRHDVPGVVVEAVIGAGDFDHSRLHGGVGQFADEQVGQPSVEAFQLTWVIVLGLVHSGGGDDVEAGLPGQTGQFFGSWSHSPRRPLHHGATADGGEGVEFGERGLGVVQFLARQCRRADEQMVVGVAGTQLLGRDVPEHGPDRRAHRPASCSASASAAEATRSPASALGTPM